MATTLKLSDPVGTWVTRHPATSRVFERHGLDYCCGGNRPLEEACRKGKADAQAVLTELVKVVSKDDIEPSDDFSTKSLSEMCDAIVSTHHEYLKRELPRPTLRCRKAVATRFEQCWTVCGNWQLTCTSTFTRRTTSCSRGHLDWLQS